MRVVIIEDEVHAQSLLSTILKEYCPKLIIIGCADCVKSGFDLIQSQDPDLVFMDIQLNDDSSFTLLDLLPNRRFKVIFTTAYEQFAHKAFKYEVIDYVMKPYDHKEIMAAVLKVDKINEINPQIITEIKSILRKSENEGNEKLKILTHGGLILLKFQDILRVEAEGSYCIIHDITGKKFMSSKPLKDIEEKLPISSFYRIHASHLINMNYVRQVKTDEGCLAILLNGDSIPVSRRNKLEFMQKLCNE